MLTDKYEGLTIEKEIKTNLEAIEKTRNNRIKLSERLKKYYQRWKFILFILNFEAVFLIVKSLQSTGNDNNGEYLTGSYSIYVILLQYFINEQNYNERSMKSHYHQIELKELHLQLKNLLIKLNTGSECKKSVADSHRIVMNNYQTMLKNNENHSQKDNLMRKLEKDKCNFLKLDFSFDNLLINLNYIIGIIILMSIIRNII